jgi:hypothetical protein
MRRVFNVGGGDLQHAHHRPGAIASAISRMPMRAGLKPSVADLGELHPVVLGILGVVAGALCQRMRAVRAQDVAIPDLIA